METLGAKLQSGENETEGFQSLAQIIAEMAVQGKRYRDLMGEKTDKPWSAEELMVLLPYDPAELTNLVNKLQEALENGQKPTVAVAEEKTQKPCRRKPVNPRMVFVLGRPTGDGTQTVACVPSRRTV